MNNFLKTLSAAAVPIPFLALGIFYAPSANAAVVIGSDSCKLGSPGTSAFTFGQLRDAFELSGGSPTAPGSAQCYNGDKLYTFNFISPANKPNFLPGPPPTGTNYSFFDTDLFSIANVGFDHTLRVEADPKSAEPTFNEADPAGIDTGTYSLGYNVSILVPKLEFARYSTSADTTNIQGSNTLTAYKSLQATGYALVCQVASGTNVPDPACPKAPPELLPGGLTSLDFLSTLIVTGNKSELGIGVPFYSDFVRQRPSEVPGPLPILGAFAAFHSARKLRTKVRIAKSISN